MKFQKGGSRLPRPLTSEHLIPMIRDLVILLSRVKGNSHSFYWEDWMYLFIQVTLDKNQFIDWGTIIAKILHEGLSNYCEIPNFYISSYLLYILAYVREWSRLFHDKWVQGIKIYEYHPHLTLKGHVDDYLCWNDIFVGRLTFKLQDNLHRKMSTEAVELVKIYGSFFTQFNHFDYIRVGGFKGEPFMLPRYVSDPYILIEVLR